MNCREMFATYVQHLRARTSKQSSIRGAKSAGRLLFRLVPVSADSPLTPEILDAFIAAAREEGLQASTINGRLRWISAAHRLCHRRGYINRLVPFEMLREPRKVPYMPGPAEIRQMLRLASEDPRVEAVLRCALATGARIGELRAARVEWVDLEEGVFRIQPTDDGWSPKSYKCRAIPLAPATLEWFRRHIASLAPACRPGDPLFQSTMGKAWPESTLNNALGRITDELGVPGGLHSIRRAFLSAVLSTGGSAEDARVLAGHSSIVVTSRYLQTTPERLREVASRVDLTGTK